MIVVFANCHKKIHLQKNSISQKSDTTLEKLPQIDSYVANLAEDLMVFGRMVNSLFQRILRTEL